MENRGGPPPLNNHGRSQGAPVPQHVTNNQEPGYDQEMDVDTVDGQPVEFSANSGTPNHSHVENQSEAENLHTNVPQAQNDSQAEEQIEVQHLHTHPRPLAHLPRVSTHTGNNMQVPQASQVRQNKPQPHPRSHQPAPQRGLKRAYEPEYGFDDAFRSAEQKQRRMGVERLPLFAGTHLQLVDPTQVSYKDHGPFYKDQLELMGHNRSMVNWYAPDQNIKNGSDIQVAAKVALDDQSLAALCKTMQQEAARHSTQVANVWIQFQDPAEQRRLSKAMAGGAYNHTAPSHNDSVLTCSECRRVGHRVAQCPKPDPKYLSLKACSACDNQNHKFDECFQVLQKLPSLELPVGPDTVEDYRWFADVLINKRVNKPPIRTSKVSWTLVLQELHASGLPFEYRGAPWGILFTYQMGKAKPGDPILGGRMHWKHWNSSQGHTDEQLPVDPLCLSLEEIIKNTRLGKLSDERYGHYQVHESFSQDAEAVENAIVEHLDVNKQSGSTKFHVDLSRTSAGVAHAVNGGSSSEPSKSAKATYESAQPNRDTSMPVHAKNEPDAEGSGIDPKVAKVFEYVSGITEECDLTGVPDDPEDPKNKDWKADFIPKFPTNPVIKRVTLPAHMFRASAARAAKSHAQKAQVKEPSANVHGTASEAASTQGGDTTMAGDTSATSVSQPLPAVNQSEQAQVTWQPSRLNIDLPADDGEEDEEIFHEANVGDQDEGNPLSTRLLSIMRKRQAAQSGQNSEQHEP